MNVSNTTIRRDARDLLNGHWNQAISVSMTLLLLSLVISGITGMFSLTRAAMIMSFFVGLILHLLLALVYYGGFLFYMHMSRNETATPKDLIAPYQMQPDRFLIVAIIQTAVAVILALPLILVTAYAREATPLYWGFLILWTLLAVALYILYSMNFALAPFLLLDDTADTADATADAVPLGAIEALRKSRSLMQNHKFALFRLHLSFIGYLLLSIGTFGLGSIWVLPYFMMAQVKFYEHLKTATH